MELSSDEYQKYLTWSKHMTRGIEPYELLHEVLLKVIDKDMKPNKDGYIYMCLKNTFIDKYSDYRKLINPKPVIFDSEPSDLPDTNHIFRTLHELRQEGKEKHANRFLQAYFSGMNQSELAKIEGTKLRAIQKSCKFVKKEIRIRYELD